MQCSPQYPVPGVAARQYDPGDYLPLTSIAMPIAAGREFGLVEGRLRRNAHRSKPDKQAKHQTEAVPGGDCSR